MSAGRTRQFLIASRRHWIWPVLLLALWVRLPGLSADRSLWMDEILSVRGVRDGVGYLPDLYRNAYGASPLSSLTSWALFKLSDWGLGGGSLLPARLPHLALGLAAIWLGWRLGRLWRRWLAGLMLALVLSLWPFKVYWDTEIRFYAGIMFFAMLLFVAWEEYRRKQGWGRLAAALVVSFLAPLNSMQAFPLIVVPWIYLGWVALARVRERDRYKHIGRMAAHGGLLVAVTFAVLLCSRGGPWTLDQLRKAGGLQKPESQAAARQPLKRLADIISLDPATGKKVADLPALSTGDFARFIRGGFGEALRPGRWSPAPLLGLADDPDTYNECLTFYPLRPAWPGGLINIVALTALLAGSLALLRLSPPLLAALWALIIAIGTALDKVSASQVTSSRYYAIPALAMAVLTGVGLAAMLGVIPWVARRWRRRWAGGAALAAGLAGCLILIVGLGEDARRSAGYEGQKYQEFYRDARGRFSQGILFHGFSHVDLYTFFQDLEILRHEKSGATGYWASPRRNAFIWGDGSGFQARGLGLLEQALDKQAVAVFAEDAGQDLEALREVERCLAPPLRIFIRPARAVYYDLGSRMFVTRGAAAIPLLPRFDALATTGTGICELTCFYEIPGTYEVRVARDPKNPILKALLNGKELKIRTQTTSASQESTTQTWTRRLARDRYAAEVMDQRIKLERAAPPVIAGSESTVFEIGTPPAPLTPQRLTLIFQRPLGERRPVAEWWLRPGRTTALRPGMELGDLKIWDSGGVLKAAPVMRATGAAGRGRPLRLALIDMAGGNAAIQQELKLNHDPRHGRTLEAGDWELLEPLELKPEIIQKTIGRSLCIALEPGPGWAVESYAGSGAALKTISPTPGGGPWIVLAGLRFQVQDRRVKILFE